MTENNFDNIVSYRKDPKKYFNIGLKHAIKKDYSRALMFLAEAVKIEPFNADYQFNLACIHAELKQMEEANETLIKIIKYIDPTLVECYFGVACNYFDMGDLKNAREYLEKYISADDEGEFVEAAYDILYYLEIFENGEPKAKNRKKVLKLIAQGRGLIDNGEYNKACLILGKALEADPFHIQARNYIAIAYFLNDEVEKGVSVAKSVLKIEDDNVFAHCNLALFLAYKGMMSECNEYLKALTKLNVDNKDDFVSFFAGIIDKIEIKSNVKRKISEALKLETLFNKTEEAYKSKYKNSFGWKKEWKVIIECAIKKRDPSYKANYEEELKEIWIQYINEVYPESLPIIKKHETWAAALEYIYCDVNRIRVTKTNLADKYNVSPSSITKRVKLFIP